MKNIRQGKILELISQHSIFEQDILLDYLKKEGFNVTQATVSRDIKELRIIKVSDGAGNYRYISNKQNTTTQHTPDRFARIFKEAVLDIDYAGHTVAIKCYTGMANAACEVFDSLHWEDVVATLAGDGTFFILMRSETVALNMCNKLKQYI